ncbi:hypothetical protein [Streptomyces sp. S465]|uniref:hypothetical protein n=1 Tax=Streptomyces sp. S465 TaxID=2979468 RepID=UPI0022A887C0|nr:hypothetical protein [Streptomyces sp. S465]WAP59115.1 hypothetical protein N6H00_31460 [Streptomyces sp. S465]
MQTASRSYHRYTSPVLVTLALLAVSACGAGTADSGVGSGSAGAGKSQLRIAVGIDAAYAPFFLADQEGLWASTG